MPDTTDQKTESRLSNLFDRTLGKSSQHNHGILTNKQAIEQHQRTLLMRQTPFVNPFNFRSVNNTGYSGHQSGTNSSDIEAVTLRQFRMSSLGC